MIKIGLLLIIGFLSSLAFAAEANDAQNLGKIRALLVKNKEIRGKFRQIRTVTDPKLVLESSGQFRFKMPLDLHWNQTNPFKLDLEMTPDKIVQKNFDGSEQVMTKQDQPVVFMFSTSFLGIFSGDQELINKNFTYKTVMTAQAWTLTLEPKDEIFRKIISDVKIKGSNFVDQVSVSEKSGNTTVINFTFVERVH